MFAVAMDLQTTAPAHHLALDANNNNNENVDLNLQRNEKYSLRQRYKRNATIDQSPEIFEGASNGTGRQTSKSRGQSQPRPPKKGKPFLSVHDLHPQLNSLGSPLSPSSVTSSSSRSSCETPKKEKPKTKAPPLSKYRRKTANARERTRMREINSAFENLRNCVPMSMCLNNNASHFDPLYLTTHQAPGAQMQVTTPGNEKLTKITTLKLAMKYIRMLTGVLNGSVPMGEDLNNNNGVVPALHVHSGVGGSSGSSCSSSNGNLKTSLLSIKVPPTQTPKKTARNTNLLMTARSKAAPTAPKVKPSPSPAAIPSYDPYVTSGVDLLFGSPCLTPPIEDSSSASDQLAMLLDGAVDEDSLKLSESCLSPPLSEQNIKVSFNTVADDGPDLELGFLLESDSDTLQLSEPCLSPLSSALDPFGDLLSSGFNEQTVLDMYL